MTCAVILNGSLSLIPFCIDNVYSTLLASKTDSQRTISPCPNQCLPETDDRESIMETERIEAKILGLEIEANEMKRQEAISIKELPKNF